MTLEQKIQAGSQPIVGKKIVHTAPHHDDILLGYFPYLINNLAGNQHHIWYLTSGYNGVSDHYLAAYLAMPIEQVQALSSEQKHHYKKEIRKAESDQKWSWVRSTYPTKDYSLEISHLDLSLYGKDRLQEFDDFSDQALLLRYLQEVQPDMITVLVDEPGCGPQTHHQTAATMMQVIDLYKDWFLKIFGKNPDLTVLGYRNIWSSFSVQQASIIFLMDQEQLDLVSLLFRNCFASQKNNFILADDGSFMNFADQAISIFLQQANLVQACKNKESDVLSGAVFLTKLQ